MAAQQSAARRRTEAEFEIARGAAPGGERWELVDGEVLVTPSPHWRHQAIILSLAIRLREYVRAQGLRRLFIAPLDVKLEPGMVTQPDLPSYPPGISTTGTTSSPGCSSRSRCCLPPPRASIG